MELFMPLLDDLNQKLHETLKNEVAFKKSLLNCDELILQKGLLRLIIGEMDAIQGRTGNVPSDDVVKQFIKKTITNNGECMNALYKSNRHESPEYNKLKAETKYLCSLLPNLVDKDQLPALMEEIKPQILAAKADGAAIGLANKHLKGAGKEYFGDDVAFIVKKWRSLVSII